MNIHHALEVVTPGAAVVSTRDAKRHCRVDLDDDDSILDGYVAAATALVEGQTGRAGVLTTYRLTLDRFPLLPNSQYAPGNPSYVAPVVQNLWPLDPSPWAVELPRSPVASVTSVRYYDVNNVQQTLDPSAYVVDAASAPARLCPASGGYWPATAFRPSAVEVTFTAGAATAAAVDPRFRQAVLLLTEEWYANRSTSEIPTAVDILVNQMRVPGF